VWHYCFTEYFSETDEDSTYFHVATVRKSCPAFEMNCSEFLEMYLASLLFFVFRSYLRPDANVGVDFSTVGGVIMHKKRKQAIKRLISGTDGIDCVPLLFDDGSSNLVTDEENNRQGSWFN